MKPNVIDVSEANFENEVVKRSTQVPVVIDFWAPWCGPCRALSPVLEDLAEKGAGRWILAKINSDENPKLADTFGVRGIPSVKAIRDGKVVDEFTGALPRSAVEQFLARILPRPEDERVAEAVQALERGETVPARAALEGVLAQMPHHDAAVLALAKLELMEKHPDKTLELLKKLADSGSVGAAVRALRAEARFAAAPLASESLEELAKRVEAKAGDLEARYQLAIAAAKSGDLDRAAEELLAILSKKRDHQDGETRLTLLDLFELMGPQDPRTEKYRARLSSILFA